MDNATIAHMLYVAGIAFYAGVITEAVRRDGRRALWVDQGATLKGVRRTAVWGLWPVAFMLAGVALNPTWSAIIPAAMISLFIARAWVAYLILSRE